MPPKSTPAAAPPPPIAPQIPSALLRSAPSSNLVVMIDSVAGDTRAAPTPCTARAAISTELEPASPHASDAAVKTARPVMKISLRPSRAAKRPPRSKKRAAEVDRVCRDHPRQATRREVKRSRDRRKRDRHDRYVENRHEVRDADDGEYEPAPGLSAGVGHGPPRSVSHFRPRAPR